MQVAVRKNINCGITKTAKALNTTEKIKMLFAGTEVTKMNRGVRHEEHKGHLACTIRDGLTKKQCLLQSSVSHNFSESF